MLQALLRLDPTAATDAEADEVLEVMKRLWTEDRHGGYARRGILFYRARTSTTPFPSIRYLVA